MQTFEDRLLVELKELVAGRAAEQEPATVPTTVPAFAPSRSPRRRRLLLGSGVLAAACAAAIAVPVLSGDGGTRANAVEKRPDGSVLVRFYELAHPERVEAKLRGFGVPAVVTFLPSGMKCAPRARYYDISRQEPIYGTPPEGAEANGVLIFPKRIRKGETLVINVWGKRRGNGELVRDYGMVIGEEVTPDHVGPCVLTGHGPVVSKNAAGDGPESRDDDVRIPDSVKPTP
jgi:hypothetical protein